MQQAEIALSLVVIFFFTFAVKHHLLPPKGAFITQNIWEQPSVLCGASSIDRTSQSPHSASLGCSQC